MSYIAMMLVSSNYTHLAKCQCQTFAQPLTEETNHPRIRLDNCPDDLLSIRWLQKLELWEIDTTERMVIRCDPKTSQYNIGQCSD